MFISDLRLRTAAKLADVALAVPPLRKMVLDTILGRLDDSYGKYERDDHALVNTRWMASHLRCFLEKLVQERPSAARALLRFLSTWAIDMRRRSEAGDAGQAAPCTVVIDPTDRCNLFCPGCYAKSSCDGSDLSYQQMTDIIDEVIDMGVTLITLSGGEPFLREKEDQLITRLAAKYKDRGFLIYSNGTLIDEQIARRLGQVGNVFPAISVEGFEHQTDARRGKGVSRQNRHVRQLLARNKVMTGFSATVTRANAEAICSDDFIDMRIEEGDLFGWFFLLQPIGRQPRADLMVTAEQRAMLRETINRWRNEDRPLFLGDFWNDAHLTGGCLAARYYFHIYADGQISPCVFSPISCGNILDITSGASQYKSLRQFVQEHPTFVATRRHQQGILDRDRPCLLIDHPEAFRDVFARGDCRSARNMPEGYLDGDIAHAIDDVASDWQAKGTSVDHLWQATEQPTVSNAEGVG